MGVPKSGPKSFWTFLSISLVLFNDFLIESNTEGLVHNIKVIHYISRTVKITGQYQNIRSILLITQFLDFLLIFATFFWRSLLVLVNDIIYLTDNII
jgi:hypothetical protein